MLRTAAGLEVFYPEKGKGKDQKVHLCCHVPEGAREGTSRVAKFGAEMKEKYMDDMRHSGGIERLEADEDSHQEFLIESTA